MNAHAMTHPSPAFTTELGRARRHDARAMTWSIVAHAAVLLWMLLSHTLSPDPPPLVEIMWLEPEVTAAAAPLPAPQKVETPTQKVVTPTRESTERFERHQEAAEVEPAPQRPDVAQDRLSNQLDALQKQLRTTRPQLAVNTPTSSAKRPAMANVESPTTKRAGLVRSDTPDAKAAPAELQRSATPNSRPRLAVAPTKDLTEHAPAVATPDENAARRTLDGAQLLGPVADRPIVSHRLPEYPDWAKREAVEGSVTLYFIVLADGSVKNNVLVQKTSGQPEFDQNAQQALKDWRFTALDGAREQWGTITFHFRLRDH